jgi:hypothetical protein
MTCGIYTIIDETQWTQELVDSLLLMFCDVLAPHMLA